MRLNYHHLYYFWATVREGGVSKASAALHVTQPTISKQLRLLEEQLGEDLFDRRSARMTLTESGQLAFDYAEEIFSLGNEFVESLQGVAGSKPRRLRVGISDVLPKLVCHRILEPVLDPTGRTCLICEEDMTDRLLAELSLQRLDLVLTDAPIAGAAKVKAFNHFLGDCGVTFFASASTRTLLRESFPDCLHDAPFLAPTDETQMRRSLERWFTTHEIRPRIVAEFHDSALMKVFGREGAGVFVGPSVIAEEICREYESSVIGEIDTVRESFYAITVERKVKHPAMIRIAENARRNLFGRAAEEK